MLFVITLWRASPAIGYTIQINNPLAGGDFYQTMTAGSAKYDAVVGGANTFITVPPLADLNVAPTLLSQLSHPVVGMSGKTGKLYDCCLPLSAREGATTVSTLGTATHVMNVGGTFRVVPEGTEPAAGFVPLLAKGLIDGEIGVSLKALAGPPSASFSASIFIENLGTASASASSAGTQSETIGVSGTISKEPGVTGGIESSVQVTTSGTGPQNFHMLGKVPVNEDLNWNFSFTLSAMNTENFLGGKSAAWSYLTSQFVNLTAQSQRHRLKKEDPFFSESVFAFDATTGQLSVRHPSAALSSVVGEAIVEDDGSPGPTPSPTSYAGFVPEIEAILADDDFSTSDGLLGALLNYSGIHLSQTNPNGTISFTDGTLQFADPHNAGAVLATAALTHIMADPSTGSFMANLTNFQYDALQPGESALAGEFAMLGGQLWFDPDIIFDSNLFTESAESSPYTVDGAPVPEPSALLLAVVALAAASFAGRGVADR
jgi:hypothetical protein